MILQNEIFDDDELEAALHPEEFYMVEPRGNGMPFFVVIEE